MLSIKKYQNKTHLIIITQGMKEELKEKQKKYEEIIMISKIQHSNLNRKQRNKVK
jgi:hypothetical protein